MLADFYIPRLTIDMKIAVHKNHLVGQSLYTNLVHCKKTASVDFILILFFFIFGSYYYFLCFQTLQYSNFD